MNRLSMLPLLIFIVLGASAAALPAQEPKKQPEAEQRLQQLLRELRETGSKAWTAHLAALEAKAATRDAEAAELRKQAKELQQRADTATAAAAALRAEQAKLQELQKLLAGLPMASEASQEVAAKPAAKQPEPAKPAAKDPPAEKKQPEPVKSEPMKSEPVKAPAAAAASMPSKDLDDAQNLVTWAQVSTIFEESCTSCHDADEQKGGLDLGSFATARNGGGSGQSIVPGDPDQSRLYRMVTLQEKPYMPRGADPLSKEQQDLLRTWIEQGASQDAAAAKAFLAEKAAAQKAAAAEAKAMPEPVALASPMPEAVPPLAVRMPDRPGPIASLARSPTASLLAMPGLEQLLLCDTELQTIAVLPCAWPRLGTVTFAEDGSAVLVAGGEPGKHGEAVLFDVRTGAVLARCGDQADVPLSAAVHRAAGPIALGGSDKHARVFRLADGAEVMAGKHEDFVLGLTFSPDGKWLAASDRTGTVQVWETSGGRIFQTLTGHAGAVHAVVFDRTGKQLLTAGADGTLRCWNVSDAKERWRQNAHPEHQALAAAFGPGERVASCGSDGVIQVFTTAGRPVAKSPKADEWLYAVAFGESDDVVFAGDWQGRIQRFDVKTKKLTATSPLSPAL